MRPVLSLILFSACVSSSVQLGEEPTDAGPRPDRSLLDAGADVEQDVSVPLPVECTHPSECVLSAPCCPLCGPSRGDIDSMPRGESRPPPACDFDCGCEVPLLDPTLIPDCDERNECSYLDLELPNQFTECDPLAGEEQCVLHLADCCACEGSYIALNVDKVDQYWAHTCLSSEITCPACEDPITELTPICALREGGGGECILVTPR